MGRIKRISLSLLLFILCLRADAAIYAVIVGVEVYDGTITNLTSAVDDAQRVYNFLNRSVPKENMILLTDAAATKGNILQAMRLFQKARQSDLVIFYFSGHGAPNVFCPSDINGGRSSLWHYEIKAPSNQALQEGNYVLRMPAFPAVSGQPAKITRQILKPRR